MNLGRLKGMVTLGEGCLAWEGGGTDIGWRSVWEGRKGNLWLGGWKVAGDMSFWATWRVALVRDHISMVAPVALESSRRGQQPHSWLRGGGLGFVHGWLFSRKGPLR